MHIVIMIDATSGPGLHYNTTCANYVPQCIILILYGTIILLYILHVLLWIRPTLYNACRKPKKIVRGSRPV